MSALAARHGSLCASKKASLEDQITFPKGGGKQGIRGNKGRIAKKSSGIISPVASQASFTLSTGSSSVQVYLGELLW